MEPEKIEGIIVGGCLGAGKTQLINFLKSRFGYSVLSVGNFFREEAEARGIGLPELHELIKTDESLDKAVDARQKQFLLTHSKYIVDSRLGAIFAPKAFSVFLQVDPLIGAQRIFDDLKGNPERMTEGNVTCVEDVLKYNAHRLESELFRYQNLYQVNHHDPKHYTIVINTTNLSEHDVWKYVEGQYYAWSHEFRTANYTWC